MLGFKRDINTLSNIGALFMNKIDNAAGITVKTVFCTIVPYFTDGFARNSWDINIGLRANFSCNNNGACRNKRFTRAANICKARRNAAW